MLVKSNPYKNVYIEEEKDNNGETLSYKQWNNYELVVHLEWERPSKYRSTFFSNILENYWTKRSYHNFNEWSITNEWSSNGNWNRHYFKQEYDSNNDSLKTISRLVSDNYDTGYKIEIENNFYKEKIKKYNLIK